MNRKAVSIDKNKSGSSFGLRLQQARKNSGYTQKSLAFEISKRLGHSFSTVSISAYESRGILPRMAILNCISEILDVPVEYLMGTSTDSKIDIPIDKLYEVSRSDLFALHGAPLYCVPEGHNPEDGSWVLVDGLNLRLVGINTYFYIADVPYGTKFYSQRF